MAKIKKGEHLDAFALLPCALDKCQECATEHEDDMPHNKDSLYYKYHFYSKHGRWPTWNDAMEHCTQDIKDYWKAELAKHDTNI